MASILREHGTSEIEAANHHTSPMPAIFSCQSVRDGGAGLQRVDPGAVPFTTRGPSGLPGLLLLFGFGLPDEDFVARRLCVVGSLGKPGSSVGPACVFHRSVVVAQGPPRSAPGVESCPPAMWGTAAPQPR